MLILVAENIFLSINLNNKKMFQNKLIRIGRAIHTHPSSGYGLSVCYLEKEEQYTLILQVSSVRGLSICYCVRRKR
jgi:hypothetical protein